MAPRIGLIDEHAHPELRDLIGAVRHQRHGKFLNLYATLAHSPDICRAWLELFTQIRQHSSIPARLRELIMLRVAVLNRAPYEFDAHAPIARAAGVNEAQLEAVQQPVIDATVFDQTEAAVLAYTEAMTLDIQVAKACFDRVREAFSEQQVLDLTVTVAGYNMVSRVLEALEVPHE